MWNDTEHGAQHVMTTGLKTCVGGLDAVARTGREAASAALLLCLAVPAFAQPAPVDRTYRGLFSPGAAVAPAGSAATARVWRLSVQSFAGVDSETGDGPGRVAPSGFTSGLATDLMYARSGRRHTYDLQASSRIRSAPGAGGVAADTQWAAARLRISLTPRTTVSAVQQVSYTPRYVPGGGNREAGSPVEGAGPLASLQQSSGVTVTRAFSRRTAGEAGYRIDRVDFMDTGRSVAARRATAGATYQARRDVSFSLLYEGLRAHTSGATDITPLTAHDAAVTVTITPVRTRRTSVEARLAPLWTHRSATTAGATVIGARGTLALTGHARLDRRVGQHWSTGLEYERRASYQPGLTRPILSNAFGAHISGTAGRSFAASASTSFVTGSADVPASRTSGITASGRIAYQTARRATTFAEVRHDTYAIPSTLTEIPGLAGQARRTSFRMGVVLTVD
ncbi:MAG: hypothetical protein Q7V01_02535 [Vicinamibacterales bacterium]|nr:hypothetical protein [Vicinamibacterales bacterium]